MSQMTPITKTRQTKESSISKLLSLPNFDLVVKDIRTLEESSVDELQEDSLF